MTGNRAVFWLLMFSMAFNLLVIGGVIGIGLASAQKKQFVGNSSRTPIVEEGRFNGASFFAALPAPEKRKARRIFNNNKKIHRQNIKQIRKLKRQLYFLLREQEMDREAVIAALAKLRESESRMSERGQLAILEILMDLDYKSRIHAVDEMFLPPGANRAIRQNRQNGGNSKAAVD